MMRQFPTRLVVPAVAAWILVFAGCSYPATGSAPGAAAPALAAAEPDRDAPVATDTVMIQNFAYAPATVTIKAGATLTWTNRDQDPHTVTSMSGPLHSPTLNSGESFHYTFTTAGRSAAPSTRSMGWCFVRIS